jgi:hypothetical protein
MVPGTWYILSALAYRSILNNNYWYLKKFSFTRLCRYFFCFPESIDGHADSGGGEDVQVDLQVAEGLQQVLGLL